MTILYIPFYAEKNIQRKKELDECLAHNVINKLIHKIILVADETVSKDTVYPFEKVEIFNLGHRATYSDMFYGVVPRFSTDDDINIISNSDIYFDHTLSKLRNIDWDRGIALSCSRWDRACNMKDLMPDELKDSKEYVVYPQWDSQDFWVFKGHIKGMFANFQLGKAGCDNRITHEMDKSGYWVFNPAKEIVGKHVHDSGVRSYIVDGQVVDRVSGPYKLLHPTDMSGIKQKEPVKIGHIGMYQFLDSEGSIMYGLQNNGDYRFVDWTTYCTNWVMKPERQKDFEEKCVELGRWSDIVFVQTQTIDILTLPIVKRMKQVNPRVKIYFWSGDVREEIPKYFTDIASDVVSLFTNDTDTHKMREMGFKSEYLQIGYPENIYSPNGHVQVAEPIVFMGNNYYDLKQSKPGFPLSKDRQDMAFFLKENYGDKFGLYGNGWMGLESGSITDGIKESSIYRGAKIGINYSHFNYSRYSSDRLLRIMGSGCFCLSHKYQDIEKDFTIGTHLDVFETLDELKEKIDYYLEHEDERVRIAKAGAEYVLKTATWDKRIQQLLKMNL